MNEQMTTRLAALDDERARIGANLDAVLAKLGDDPDNDALHTEAARLEKARDENAAIRKRLERVPAAKVQQLTDQQKADQLAAARDAGALLAESAEIEGAIGAARAAIGALREAVALWQGLAPQREAAARSITFAAIEDGVRAGDAAANVRHAVAYEEAAILLVAELADALQPIARLGGPWLQITRPGYANPSCIEEARARVEQFTSKHIALAEQRLVTSKSVKKQGAK